MEIIRIEIQNENGILINDKIKWKYDEIMTDLFEFQMNKDNQCVWL